MIRIALFGSFYRGYFVLDELLHGRWSHCFQVVGVATDDVSAPYISGERRVWQYGYTPREASMVGELAARAGIPAYRGRVKCPEFHEQYERQWCPDICISATFGQRFDRRLYGYPKFGFFNAHPCLDDGWPSRYAGPNPFKALMDDGADHARVALHRVDDGFDTGELIGLSPRIAIPPGASVVDMHKLSAPVVAGFVVPLLVKLAGGGDRTTDALLADALTHGGQASSDQAS